MQNGQGCLSAGDTFVLAPHGLSWLRLCLTHLLARGESLIKSPRLPKLLLTRDRAEVTAQTFLQTQGGNRDGTGEKKKRVESNLLFLQLRD